MASPARRPKQNPSTPLSSPPLPLPGLAIGLFAAIAAGFAASRGLRRKRHAPSPQDQESKVLSAGRDFPPLANGIQMEKDDFRALPSTKEHSTSGNPILEPAKIAASAHVSDVCLNSKNGEEACLSEDGDGKMEEMDEKEEMRIGADTHERITLKIEESVSEPSIEQLLRNGKERYPKAEHLEDDGGTEYEDDRSKEIGHEAQNLEEDNSGYCDEDKHMNDNKGEDGDDQRSSVERDPGHVLLNGRILDFVDDSCNFNDHSEILSNEHNCFADSVSESSLQEVSSAPVKPLPPVEDSGEATWLATKPGFDFTTGVVKELTDLEINFPPTEHNMADSASLSPQIKSGVLVLREEFVNANLILAESMQENEIAEKENRFSNGVVNGSKDNSQALDGGVFVWDFVPDETNSDSGRIERKVHSQDSTLSEDCSKNRTVENNDIGEDEAVIAAQAAMVHEDIRFESNELVMATHAVMVHDETVSNGIGECEVAVAAQETMVDDDVSSEREGEHVTMQALNIHKIHETLFISIGEGEAVIAAQAAMGPGKISCKMIGEDEVTVLTQAVMVSEQILLNGIEGEVVKAAQAVVGPDEISSASKKEDESLVKTQSVMVDCREHEAIVTTQEVVVHEAEIKFEDGVVIATPVAMVHDTIRSESYREDEAIVASQAVRIHEDISSENKGEDEAIVANQAVSVHEENEDQNDETMSSELLQGQDEDRSQPIQDNQIPSKTEGENGLAYYVMAKGIDVKEIEEIASSDDVCDLIFESKKALSRDNTDSNQRRSKELVVHSDADKTLLQQRGKFLEYLPLEMGLACLLIALVSFVLWHLELLTPVQG